MTLTRRGLLWAVAAVLGIAMTAALTWSVSRLAAEHIGLSSEPVSVIQGLAPPRREAHAGPVASNEHSSTTPARRGSTPTVALPSTPQPAAPATPSAAPAPQTQTPALPAAPPAPPASRAAAAHTNGGDHPDDSGGGGSGGHHSGPDD
jgi:hypothetical protein